MVLGPALVAFVGPALVAFVGPALELLLGGAALVLLDCANACCDNCIPTIVKDVSSIAEIAIADSVGTFAYVFLCIKPQRLGMKFICFRPPIQKIDHV